MRVGPCRASISAIRSPTTVSGHDGGDPLTGHGDSTRGAVDECRPDPPGEPAEHHDASGDRLAVGDRRPRPHARPRRRARRRRRAAAPSPRRRLLRSRHGSTPRPPDAAARGPRPASGRRRTRRRPAATSGSAGWPSRPADLGERHVMVVVQHVRDALLGGQGLESDAGGGTHGAVQQGGVARRGARPRRRPRGRARATTCLSRARRTSRQSEAIEHRRRRTDVPRCRGAVHDGQAYLFDGVVRLVEGAEQPEREGAQRRIVLLELYVSLLGQRHRRHPRERPGAIVNHESARGGTVRAGDPGRATRARVRPARPCGRRGGAGAR